MKRLAIALITLLASVPAQATEAGWALLREGGKIILLRHANAPGVNDPANFELDNCRTQRNLSERGRQQARRIGSLVAARAAPTEEVMASRYCRTMDTAQLAFGEKLVEPFAALDPYADEPTEQAAIAEIHQRVNDYTGSGNLILVTHDTVIKALTGAPSREGEMLIVIPVDGSFKVIGRIAFN